MAFAIGPALPGDPNSPEEPDDGTWLDLLQNECWPPDDEEFQEMMELDQMWRAAKRHKRLEAQVLERCTRQLQ